MNTLAEESLTGSFLVFFVSQAGSSFSSGPLHHWISLLACDMKEPSQSLVHSAESPAVSTVPKSEALGGQ